MRMPITSIFMAIMRACSFPLKSYIQQIKKGGSLIIHESIDEQLAVMLTHVTKHIYSMSRGQFFAGNITAHSGFFEFDLCGFGPKELRERIRLGIPGFHNVENAVAASIAAHVCGVKCECY
jgi:UDP-N-acetylmuramate--alanine ligase